MKIANAITLAMAAILITLALTACQQPDSTPVPPTPTPTPQGPVITGPEAIAAVKTWLARIPAGDSNCLVQVSPFFNQGTWHAEHTSPGGWLVRLEGGGFLEGKEGHWRIYENSMTVASENQDTLPGRLGC